MNALIQTVARSTPLRAHGELPIVILDLEALSREAPGTRVTWALRRDAPELGGGGRDELAARGALGEAVRRLLDAGRIEIRAGFTIEEIAAHGGALAVHAPSQQIAGVDEIVATVATRESAAVYQQLVAACCKDQGVVPEQLPSNDENAVFKQIRLRPCGEPARGPCGSGSQLQAR